jgi:hypothetical protein
MKDLPPRLGCPALRDVSEGGYHEHRHNRMCDRSHSLLSKSDSAGVMRCFTFVLIALISALGQTPSQRSGPTKRFPPSAVHHDSPPSPSEQTVVPRFRGRRHTSRAAMLNRSNYGGVSPFTKPYPVTSRVQRLSTPSAPPSNGFGFRPSMLTGQIPTAVVTGDFNGDGKLDWAVSSGEDNSIWLYLGKGDGTAALPTILPTVGIGAGHPLMRLALDKHE